MRILIIDDSEKMRRTIRGFVSDLADETYEACDGGEALAVYRLHLPDWVLMDIKMAGLDGIAATRRIKAAHPEANVMIVTDYDDAALREAAREAGACRYVLKEDLLAVRDILGAGAGSLDGDHHLGKEGDNV